MAGAAAPGAAPPARLPVVLVTGATAAAREQALAAQLQPGDAVLLTGLPAGNPLLPPSPLLERIVSACPCCAGDLVLRVTLNRLLRQRPTRLLVGVAGGEHLDQLRSWLQATPYDQLLELAGHGT